MQGLESVRMRCAPQCWVAVCGAHSRDDDAYARELQHRGELCEPLRALRILEYVDLIAGALLLRLVNSMDLHAMLAGHSVGDPPAIQPTDALWRKPVRIMKFMSVCVARWSICTNPVWTIVAGCGGAFFDLSSVRACVGLGRAPSTNSLVDR